MSGIFHGSYVALPTPFVKGHARRVDFEALGRLVSYHLDSGTQGLVVCGSTGESTTLTPAERMAITSFTAGALRGRMPLLVGVGSPCTYTACDFAESAERSGADGLLAVAPAYNRPSQEGLLAHFGALAESTALPLVLYNVPSRTACDLLPDTVARLAERHANIVAIKEASASLDRVYELCEQGALDVLCGDDTWIADGMQLGCVGVIGVVSNLAPTRVAELVQVARPAEQGGDEQRAANLVERLRPLVKMLTVESNPTPLKFALSVLGLCSNELRLPLVPVRRETARGIEEVLRTVGLAG